MARLKRRNTYQGLDQLNVYIEDKSVNSSDYFRIFNLPEIFPGGKTAFLIDGSDNLVIGSEVKVEIVDADGNVVYSEYPQYLEGTSRLVSVWLYEDTAVGPATLTIVGQAKNVPDEWKNYINVRWQAIIKLDRTLDNDQPIRFYQQPNVYVQEVRKPYLVRQFVSSQSIEYTTGSIRASYSPRGQYVLEISGGNFTNQMVGGKLTVVPVVSTITPTVTTAPTYSTYISEIWNQRSALAETPYTFTGSTMETSEDALPYDARVRRWPPLNTYNFGYNAFTISYDDSASYSETENYRSFAKVTIADMGTFSGDVKSLNLYMKSVGSVGTYELVDDTILEDIELLVESESVNLANRIGYFYTQSTIDNFWTASRYGDQAPATLTYNSEKLLDAMHISGALTGSTNYFLVEPTTHKMDFYKNSEYTFKANLYGVKTTKQVYTSPAIRQAVVNNSAESGIDQPQTRNTAILKIYLSGSAFSPKESEESETTFGKLVQEIELATQANESSLVYEKNFISDYDGEGKIVFKVEAGEWYISDVSIKTSMESGFSPDVATFYVPIPDWQRNDTIAFKAEFLNLDKKKSRMVATSSETYIEGGNVYIIGDDNLLTGSMYIGSQIQTGLELAGASGSFFKSLEYVSYASAAAGTTPAGFMIWSGSVQSAYTDEYQAVGLELHGGSGSVPVGNFGRTHALRFRTDTGRLEITGSIYATDGFFSGSVEANQILVPFGGPYLAEIHSNGYARFVSASIGGWNISSESFQAPGNTFMLSGSGVISASNFYVDAQGHLTASSAYISGILSASIGNIGGWTINTGDLRATSDKMKLSGSGVISASDFYVNEQGSVTASNVNLDNFVFAGTNIFHYIEIGPTNKDQYYYYVTGSTGKIYALIDLRASIGTGGGNTGQFIRIASNGTPADPIDGDVVPLAGILLPRFDWEWNEDKGSGSKHVYGGRIIIENDIASDPSNVFICQGYNDRVSMSQNHPELEGPLTDYDNTLNGCLFNASPSDWCAKLFVQTQTLGITTPTVYSNCFQAIAICRYDWVRGIGDFKLQSATSWDQVQISVLSASEAYIGVLHGATTSSTIIISGTLSGSIPYYNVQGYTNWDIPFLNSETPTSSLTTASDGAFSFITGSSHTGDIFYVSGSGSFGYVRIAGDTIVTDNLVVSQSASFGSADIVGALNVGGVVTAQEFHTEYVSASIIYMSGSTKFGDSLDDRHDFTGSVNITGSLTVLGTTSITGSMFGTSSWALSASYVKAGTGSYWTGSTTGEISRQSAVQITGSMFLSGSLRVGYLNFGGPAYGIIVTGSNSQSILVDSNEDARSLSSALVLDRYRDWRGAGILIKNKITTNKWFVGVPYQGVETGSELAFQIGYHTTRPDYPSSSILYVSGTGVVGVGTTEPRAKFDTWGSSVFGYYPASHSHQFTGSLRVTGSGDHYIVGGSTGIGTTDPQATLHVWGILSASALDFPIPLPPMDLTPVEIDDYVSIGFSQSTTPNIDEYELWRAQNNETASYNLVGIVKSESVSNPMTLLDNGYTISGSLFYRAYALKNGVRSVATESTIDTVGQVADVTDLTVTEMVNHYVVQYDVPQDRRLAYVEIKKDANENSESLAEGSAVSIYQGKEGIFVYEIPAADLGKWHQFWVYSITSETGSATLGSTIITIYSSSFWTGSATGEIVRESDVRVTGSLNIYQGILDYESQMAQSAEAVYTYTTGILTDIDVAHSNFSESIDIQREGGSGSVTAVTQSVGSKVLITTYTYSASVITSWSRSR